MTPPRVWKTGERVLVTYDERAVPATVELASTNGRSLMISFEALLGGYAGMMPVLWSEAHRCFECMMLHRPVELAELGEEAP